MTKVTLNPITSTYVAASKLTSNFEEITEAFENTLSRDGSSPNQMEALIDMNSNQIINLGEPTADHHAVTKAYVDELVDSITVAEPSTEVGTSSYTSTGGSADRTLAERGQDFISALDFVTSSTKRAELLADTSTGDDAVYLQAAIAYALALSPKRKIWVAGHFKITADIPGFDEVQWAGPGSVTQTGGARWYFEANKLNTGFSPLGYNTIYVNSATGSNSNSGLSVNYPVADTNEAFTRFVGNPYGFKRIIHAEGVYRVTGNTFAIESTKANKMIIQGPSVTAWDNSSPPTEPVAITAITAANPAVVTAAGHSRSIGDKIMIFDAVEAASAEHESIGKIYTISNVSGNDLTLDVDGSAWSAYVGSGKILSVNGSTPKAIFLGTKSTSTYALTQDSDDYVEYQDLCFVNWGTRATAQNAGGIYVGAGTATLTNIHAYQCGVRTVIRDFSRGTTVGGYVWNCGVGDWCVGGARVTFGGTSNPDSAALTNSTIYHKCIKAWDIWEDCTGHCDGAIVKDCDYIGEIFGGSSMVAYYNRYTNTTGSPLGGWIVRNAANLSRSDGTTDVLSGDFAPLVYRYAGGSVTYSTDTSTKTRRDLTLLYRELPNASTANGTDQTIMTYTVPKAMMPAKSLIRVRSKYILANTLGDVLLKLKVNGANFYTHTIPAYANQQSGFMEVEYVPNAAGTARASVHIRVFETNGALQYERYSNFTPTFDSRTADLTLTLTANIANAADVCQCTVAEVWADTM